MIIKKFEEQVEKFPSKDAVITETLTLTYAELNRRANRIAYKIKSVEEPVETTRNKEIAALLFEHSADMVAAVLAALKAGKAYVPLDINYPESRLVYMLQNSQAFFILTNSRNFPLAEKIAAAVQGGPAILNIDAVDDNIPGENMEREASGDKPAYILYTSGSTGQPKGVMQNLENVYYYIRNWTERFSITSADRMTLFSAFSHDGAGQDMFAALLNGAALYPYNILDRTNIAELSQWLLQEKITIWHSVPTLYRYFVNTLSPGQRSGFPDLRFILLGGEQIREHDIRVSREFFPEAVLANVYGQTESSVNSTWLINPREQFNKILIGEPLDRTEILIIDENDEVLENIGVGEIVTACEHVALGYWQDPENSKNVFAHDPELGELYYTGDQGRLLADGNIEFIGRKDSQVKVRGFRVEVGEIETALLEHEIIKEAVVTAKVDAEGDTRLCAYVVPDVAVQASTEKQDVPVFSISQMREYLSRRLPEYMIPSYLMQLDALPQTPNGKIDRKRLPEPEQVRPELDVTYAAPATNLETEIAAIWQEVLKVDKVGLYDNFFDLGGTSFSILNVMRSLFEKLGMDIPVVTIFRYPTVSSLASYLSSREQDEKPVKTTRKRTPLLPRSPIAVIGMAGRFPGARNIAQFWENLKAGVESISFFSSEELEKQGVDPRLLGDPAYVGAFGVAGTGPQPLGYAGRMSKNKKSSQENKISSNNNGIEYFDAFFFNYSPVEAQMMDPQLRIMHEVCWEALEDAGYNAETFEGLIGLYAGNAPNQYWSALTYLNRRDDIDIGFLNSNYSTKVSYKLNLTGPSYIVQTACSTSLVAVHLACVGLNMGECDMALAGGVSISLPDKEGYLYREGMILSPDGHCRVFDAAAGGTIFGNGAGIVVLKRLEDALADGDTISAVIKGSATNNDGSRKVGVTAPSVEGQAEVIRAALELAKIDPGTIGYIEAHGTGTILGDPVEIEALKLAFDTGKKGYCGIGSVKSNVGHLNAASGVTGFIKTVLTLKHRLLPPSTNFESPNPEIDFENSPFFVVKELTEWKTGPSPAAVPRAGVSAFGIGGTNAHVVLEEYKSETNPNDQNPNAQNKTQSTKVFAPLFSKSGPPEARALSNRERRGEPCVPPSKLILLSARTQPALEKMSENLVHYLKENPSVRLADAAYTLQVGRKAFKHRRMLVCSNKEEIDNVLSTPVSQPEEGKKPIIFMLAGQGTQYVNMGIDLYQNEPEFRQEMDRCFEILNELGLDIKTVLYPQQGAAHPPSESLRDKEEKKGDRQEKTDMAINNTEIVQPLIFIFEYALAKLLVKWGITPTAMIGYSLGEYVAACLSGVFSLRDALKLVVFRGKAAQRIVPGVMLNVPLPEKEIKPLLDKDIYLSIVNDPTCVVSGTEEAVQSFEKKMKEQRLLCARVNMTHAFHSPLMEPMRQELEKRAVDISLDSPRIPYISNVSGDWITAADALNPKYWGKHLCAPARFSDGMQKLLSLNNAIFIEIGPGRVLGNMVRQHSENKLSQVVLNLIRHQGEKVKDDYYLLKKLGQLWLNGADVDWSGFYGEKKRRRIALPTYPFERQRYWLEGNPFKTGTAQFAASPVPREDAASTGTPGQQEKTGAEANIPRISRPELSAVYVPPHTQNEKKLTVIWQELLGIDQVGTADDFFELGGDSLKAIAFSGRIHQETDIEVPITEFFDRPTIKELAEFIEDSGDGSKFYVIENAEEKEYYPLSSAQRRLYVFQELNKESTGYNLARAIELDEEFSLQKVKSVLARMIDRHESLRTSFEIIDGQSVQRIHKELDFDIEYHDITSDPGKREEIMAGFVRPFDLTEPPLFRLALVKIAKKKYLMLFDFHHIITDFHSSNTVFAGEFLSLYRDEEPRPLKIQYKDYSNWQYKRSAAGLYENMEAYWLGEFKNPPPLLNLPYDFERPREPHFEGAWFILKIEASRGKAFKDLLTEENATLFMGLMAVYNVLLFTLSGSEDIVVGTPTAGRNHPDLTGIIGIFVNMLVLRTFPGPGKTFSDFLQEMKSKVLKALENQDYQFEELVKKLSLQREAGQNPLFEIMFTFQSHAEEGGNSAPEETFLDIATGASKFDLGLEVTEFGDLFYCRFEYKTRLFKPGTIQRFAEYFKQIMMQVTENKDILLKDIRLTQDILEPTAPVMDVEFSF